ncbi:MAG: ANTAR domain-containing protein [Clostridiales bacterium]|nr:ANTAR domain-containing protein [Clostridiales bacterium]MCI7574960.1 ANTAR domain-containing protein [Clostridiales bacterium]
MAAGKTKYRVLVAGGNEKLCELLSEILPKNEYAFLPPAKTAGEVRRLTMDRSVDLVILNAPLKDEFGIQLAQDLAENNMGVLLLTGSDVFEQVSYRVEQSGVITLAKPTTKQSLYIALRALTALRSKLLQMEQKTKALQQKVADIHTVNHAKWLLIQHDNMTENEAHRFIEKQAMDMRLSRREVAESIIRTYDMGF